MSFAIISENFVLMQVALGLWRISRPLNVAFIILTATLGSYLAGWQGSPWLSLFCGCALAAISIAGYALNDLLDIGIDRINRPRRPLPSHQISPPTVIAYLIVMVLVGLGAGLAIAWQILLYLLAVLILIVLYDAVTKRLGFPGNLTVALLTSSALIAGPIALGLAIDNLWAPLCLAFLLNLAREILKDIEDAPGDKSAGVKSLALLLGINNSSWIAVILALATVPIAVIYGINEGFHLHFWLILTAGLIIPILIALIPILGQGGSKAAGTAQRVLKFAMLGGLLAFYLGGIFPPPPFQG
jgi:geranylgeranylglycerol-phosphate geranylgeranyltransferase